MPSHGATLREVSELKKKYNASAIIHGNNMVLKICALYLLVIKAQIYWSVSGLNVR